jgi:hypothetical protein
LGIAHHAVAGLDEPGAERRCADAGLYDQHNQLHGDGGERYCSGAPLACPLAFGTNVISTVVTAADNTTRTYVVTVTRAGDATLAGLELSA